MDPHRLEQLHASITSCSACPRLVAWREAVAAAPRAAFVEQAYWGRPVPGFGDREAWLVLVGLAPAAHGANRTGRMFTGDRSGDVLVGALHRAGLASAGTSVALDDGLELDGAWLTAALRCAPPANAPLPEERRACSSFLSSELELLEQAEVILALGALAYDALFRLGSRGAKPERHPRFAHGLEVLAPMGRPFRPGQRILCSYHPSQRNVFTGLLTPAMLDEILARAHALGARAAD